MTLSWAVFWQALEAGAYPLLIVMLTCALIYMEKRKLPAKNQEIKDLHAAKENAITELREEFQQKIDEKDVAIQKLYEKRIEERDTLITELLEKAKRETEAATELNRTMVEVKTALTTLKARQNGG